MKDLLLVLERMVSLVAEMDYVKVHDLTIPGKNRFWLKMIYPGDSRVDLLVDLRDGFANFDLIFYKGGLAVKGFSVNAQRMEAFSHFWGGASQKNLLAWSDDKEYQKFVKFIFKHFKAVKRPGSELAE
jgi:hypothetical protein